MGWTCSWNGDKVFAHFWWGNLLESRSRWPRGLRRWFGRLVSVIVGSNSVQGMDVCLCVSVCLSSLCNRMITRPKESYRVS
jgi:hypothetical protein